MSMKGKLGSVEEQREFFLLKFPDVERIDVMDMFDAFMKYDTTKSGEVDEHAVQLMMADLGVHKTLIELRAMLSAIDFSAGKKVQFMELCCASFGKDFYAMSDHTDHEAVARAREKAEEHQKLLDEIAATHAAEQAAAEAEAQKLAAESQLSGVAGMKAFFLRAAASTPDKTMTNAERIKQEAAFRKAQKEASKALQDAEEEMKRKNKSDEDIAREVAALAQKMRDEADAAAAAAVEQERAERAARKAAFNARYGGGN